MSKPLNIKPESFEWARAHFKRFGASDVFPQPFEFAAIESNWTAVRPHLAAVDFEAHQPSGTFQLMVPKPGIGFRAATELDPLDAYLYAALSCELGDAIERFRVPHADGVAFSYRIKIEPTGTLFDGSDEGWAGFVAAQKVNASASNTVFTADIADFYNQIYHHRVENALESAGIDSSWAQATESFLLGLTAKQSRGLPVGPSASIVFAEACLGDVDQFLQSAGILHIRYVDDFCMFCETSQVALKGLESLTRYLYTAHRLCLQSSKTRIIPAEEFKASIVEIESDERSLKEAKAKKIIAEAISTHPYPDEIDEEDVELTSEDELELVRETIKELFEESLKRDVLPLGVVRYLLRRARRLRLRILYPSVFENMAKLSPVFRDVCLYLNDTLTSEISKGYASRLILHLRNDDFGSLPFVRMWAFWLIQMHPELSAFRECMELAKESQEELGRRDQYLFARAFKHVPTVRAAKETWAGHAPRDRRALIYAASVLPPDERNSWLELIRARGDVLDQAVASLVRGAK